MSDPTQTPAPATTTVAVESSWTSKINWTQAVTGGAMILAYFTGGKVNLTADQQAALVVVIGLVGNAVTWIMRTWFTTTVTPASAAKLPK